MHPCPVSISQSPVPWMCCTVAELACCVCIVAGAHHARNSRGEPSFSEGEDTQKIYDELPFNEDLFNLRRADLELYDKLGKVGGAGASGDRDTEEEACGTHHRLTLCVSCCVSVQVNERCGTSGPVAPIGLYSNNARRIQCESDLKETRRNALNSAQQWC